MNTIRTFAFFTLAQGVFALSANAAGIPDWVSSGKHVKFPSQFYVSGVGTAANQSDAEANALSSIGKQIMANVKTASQSSMSAAGESVSTYFNQDVEVESTEQIQGAKFAERFNNSDGTWSVLAVLKIDDFIGVRRKKAQECLEKAVKILPAGSKAEIFASAAETFKTSAALKVKALECGGFLSELHSAKSLSPAVKSADFDSPEIKKLEAKVEVDLRETAGRLSKLTFTPTCTTKIHLTRKAAEPESQICEDFEKVLMDFGLSKGGENSSFEVKMKYIADEKGDGTSTLVFMRSSFSVEIVEKSKGTGFFKHTAKAEAGGSNPAAAVAKMDKKTLDAFTETFLKIFKK